MLYSILNDENLFYINLHAECALHTYVNDFYADDLMDGKDIKSISRQFLGMYNRNANAQILENIFNHDFEDKDLSIDFSKIEKINDNNITSIEMFIKKKFLAKGKNVYLLNLKKCIFDKMNFNEMYVKIGDTTDYISIKIGENNKTITYEELTKKEASIFEERLEHIVQECTVEFEENERMHRSVPVYLYKYINVKKIAQSNARFFRFCIYRMGKKLIERNLFTYEYQKNKNISLFFHTMNGAYIATQLALLFNVDMVYLDHLGPVENLHRKHFEQCISDSKEYIIISDVICLGGEIGRAKTIIEYCGGRVLGETCFADVMTVTNQEYDKRISLYTVSKYNNKIDYIIKTDLCNKCEKEKHMYG